MSTTITMFALCFRYAYCYVLSNTPFTFSQQETYCNHFCSSHLASLHSPQDYQQTLTIVDNNPSFVSGNALSVWIGLNDIDVENFWIYTDTSPFDYGSNGTIGVANTGIYPWDLQEPTNYNGEEHCVNLFEGFNYKWNDSPCSNKMRGFCNHCDAKLIKYFFRDVHSDWDEAESWCSTNLGTSLASIHSQADMNEADKLCKIGNSDCWIGLTEPAEGTWIWSDGTAFDFGSNGNGAAATGMYPWNPGEPSSGPGGSEHCAQLFEQSGSYNTWNDNGCTVNIPCLCNLPSDICYQSNWKIMLKTGNSKFATNGCELVSTYNFIAIIQTRQWLYVSSSAPWVIEYIFAFNDIYSAYGEAGISIHHFDSLCDYFHVGIKVDTNLNAHVFIYQYYNDQTDILVQKDLFIITYGTYYVLKTELSYIVTTQQAVFSVFIGEEAYIHNFTVSMPLNHLQHSKYIGIENGNVNMSAKSLFMSQAPNYVFNEPQFNQTWSSLQCMKTSHPTVYPTTNPSVNPTSNPTMNPVNPTVSPTNNPSHNPTTGNPTVSPSTIPTFGPSLNPTSNPSSTRTAQPSKAPTESPSTTPAPTEKEGQTHEETETTAYDDSDEKEAKTSSNTSSLMYIVIGAIILVIVICLIIFLVFYRKKKQKHFELQEMKSTSIASDDKYSVGSPHIELSELQSNTETPNGIDNTINGGIDEIITKGAVDNIVDNIGIYVENDKDEGTVGGMHDDIVIEGNNDNETHDTHGASNIAPDEFIIDEDETQY